MSIAKEIRVRVPASSANLGPGFDALALALGLYLRCTLRQSGRGLRIKVSGADAAEIPQDRSNLVWRTFEKLAGTQAGDDLELEIANEIPVGKGLGSSAAAILAGLALANEWVRLNKSREQLIEIAAGLEGHPDNVAAATLGGLVVSCQQDDGKVLAVPYRFSADVEVVLVVPQLQLATEAARAALPENYARRDAVFNLQRLALMFAAFQSGRSDALAEAMRDRLHQPYRAPLIPGFAEVLKLQNVPGLLGVALSGAGPSVVAFCRGAAETAGKAIADCFRRHGISAQALPLPVDQTGLLAEHCTRRTDGT
jgi:homoserine kinase